MGLTQVARTTGCARSSGMLHSAVRIDASMRVTVVEPTSLGPTVGWFNSVASLVIVLIEQASSSAVYGLVCTLINGNGICKKSVSGLVSIIGE